MNSKVMGLVGSTFNTLVLREGPCPQENSPKGHYPYLHIAKICSHKIFDGVSNFLEDIRKPKPPRKAY